MTLLPTTMKETAKYVKTRNQWEWECPYCKVEVYGPRMEQRNVQSVIDGHMERRHG